MQKQILKCPQALPSVIKMFVDKLATSDFAEMVTIEANNKLELVVKIIKFGTSTIIFSVFEYDVGCELTLKSTDISFFHKKHIDSVYTWIAGVVTENGGTIEV